MTGTKKNYYYQYEEMHIPAGPLRLGAIRNHPQHSSVDQNKTRKKVLALHGWLDNAASFAPLSTHLQDIDLVCLDFPGHGKSDTFPAGLNLNFVDLIPYVLYAADSLGWKSFSLLGHSMGGAISTLIASALPERIERLMLIEALGPISENVDNASNRMRKFLKSQNMHTKRKRVYSSRQTALEVRQRAGIISDQAVETLAERGLVETTDGWSWVSDYRLQIPSAVRMTEEQVQSFLKKISCPTLLVYGLSSPFSIAALEERMQCISDLKKAAVSGNHHMHMDDPEPVAKIIQSFLTDGSRGEQNSR